MPRSHLIGTQIGPWLVLHIFRNRRGRNVYVCENQAGRTKGLKGYELNRIMATTATRLPPLGGSS